MSQSSQTLGSFVIDIAPAAHTESTFQCLTELADRAFALAGEQAGLEPSSVAQGIGTRFANVLYSVGNTDVETFPFKVVLHQKTPAMQFQQVVLDFQTKTVECEGQPNLPIDPEEVKHAQEEIKPCLQDVLKRKKGKKSTRQLQENRAWRDFFKRLESNDLFPAQVCPDPDSSHIHRRCPLCETQTTPCTSCHAIMCLNKDCAASQLIPFRSCTNHVSEPTCLPCLENATEIPSLGQCPDCNLWFCQHELTWCIGRPADVLSSLLRHFLLQTPDNNRQHPIKPIGCSSCIGDQERPYCSNGKCWSRVGGDNSVCESCSPEGGLWCTCEACWICDDCKTSTMDNYFKECSRCGQFYCVYDCRYIQFCRVCGRTSLCDDCVEEDRSPLSGPDAAEGVTMEGKCSVSHCMWRICDLCLEGARCAGCSKTFCGSCIRLELCDSCGGCFCPACYRTHKRRCDGCDAGQKTNYTHIVERRDTERYDLGVYDWHDPEL